MIGPWDRIEGSSHDDELDAGVEARVADPLWLLARQWQVGEFRGDDAGSPVAAQLDWRATPLQSYRPGADGPVVPMPAAQPLERAVEAAPPPSTGAAGIHWSARLAGQVTRRLARAGNHEAIDELVRFFALPPGDVVALPGTGTTAVELLRRRSFNGAALLAADAAATREALAELPTAPRDEALAAIDRWRTETRARFAVPPVDTWDERRLEHRFSVAAGSGSNEVVLTADEYTGGHLDWYSFDVDPKQQHTPDAPPRDRVVTDQVTAIPTPVRYAGMPAARWWAFEQGDVHVGDLASAPGDLGRLLLADYATVYGNDWFSIPLRLPLGTLAQVVGLRTYDTMGGHTVIPPAATLDDRAPGRRVFRLYELSGDPSVGAGLAPLLLLPPCLSGSDVGPALERVELVRDEAANLAWGIERLVEGPTGRAVDRLQHWRTTGPSGSVPKPEGDVTPPKGKEAGGEAAGRARTVEGGPGTSLPGPPEPVPVELPRDAPDDGADLDVDLDRDAWRYRLESTAPPFWIPFVPTHIGTGAQVRLRRARMQEWELLDRSVVGPKGELLQPRQMMTIEEEEVPRGGATLERRWQLARWTDGSVHVWLQRSKQLGYGERTSGLRWDSLVEFDDRAPRD